MLDTDNPVDSGVPTPEPTAAQKATPQKATARKTTPPKAAPRKATASKAAPSKAAPSKAAPSKAAPSKAAARKATAPVPIIDAAAAVPSDESFKDTAEPPRKAPRQATARKRVAAGADLRTASAPAQVASASPAQAGEALAGDPATEGAPAPRKRTSRSRKATPETPAEPGGSSANDDPSDVRRTAPEPPPGVVFVTPSEAVAPTPSRRRRRSESATAGAETAIAAEPATTTSALPHAAELEHLEDPDDVREVAAEEATGARRRRRRGRRGRGSARPRDVDETTDAADLANQSDQVDVADPDGEPENDVAAPEAGPTDSDNIDTADESISDDESGATARRRRRRRRRTADGDAAETGGDDPPNTVVHVRETRSSKASDNGDGVRGVRGSTRLEAKRQRRRDGRESGRRRPPILTESEFLARREAVDRVMAVRQLGDRTQIAVLEDGMLVEHYVTRASSTSYVGNVYLGRVQNVLPSMEAAFIDIGKGRNGVLYAGEVNWDASGLEGKSRAIENALGSGDTVLVQVTKDPIAHKGARLTSQVSLPGRFLVYVPGGGMTGISRKLPDTERHRLKSILKKIVPEDAGVIIRTAAEGASEEDLTDDVDRLKAQWESIQAKAAKPKGAPLLVYGEPDLAIRVVRDVFNEDFGSMVVQGDDAWSTISHYLNEVAPDLVPRLSRQSGESDLFHDLRADEQLTKALDRKVFLPSGGSLVIDRTEAMTVIDVNTGKFIGSGGNLEQTVTRNNLEAAEEIVRQLRLRDVGGIVVIDFIDMVLESNRDLVLRRLTECLGRDRTKHQVAEVTSLGLVQMTRKRVGEGLLEAFSEPCPTCGGRGVLVHSDPIDNRRAGETAEVADDKPARRRSKRGKATELVGDIDDLGDIDVQPALDEEQRRKAASAMAAIAGVNHQAGDHVDDVVDLDITDADGDTVAVELDVADADAVVVERLQPSIPSPDQAAGVSVPRRGRRRAASRPAGPPVPVGG